jgi:hypothetical protein
MKRIALSALVVWSLSGGLATAGDVTLEIRDGFVYLSARNATIGQILAEWARVGQTKIVNGERVPGGLVTILLEGVPERQALDVVLRTITGYMAAPRQTQAAPNLSAYDRILVLPTPAAAALPPVAAAQPDPGQVQRPGWQRFQRDMMGVVQPLPTEEHEEDNMPPGMTVPTDPSRPDMPPWQGGGYPGQPTTMPAVPGVGTQPPTGNPPAQGNPWMPVTGSPMPGVVTPVPTQTEQPPAQQQPPAQRRPIREPDHQ